jgi:hypothetical protein
MKPLIAGLVLSFAITLVGPPRITVQNPKLLYAAAMYKTAVGDTESALRLVQRAEQARQPAGAAQPNISTAAGVRSAIFTIL